MTVLVDFLPEAYRTRQLLQQQRRQQAWLCVPVVLGLLLTDAVLAYRGGVGATMASNAAAYADQQEQRAEQCRQLTTRLGAQQQAIAAALPPLQMPRLSAVIDALLVATPSTVTLQEISYRHTPWDPTKAGTMRILANSATADQLEQYLALLDGHALLPALTCTRTFRGPTGLGFELDSAAPTSAPR